VATNWSVVNRSSKLLLPTDESPTSRTCSNPNPQLVTTPVTRRPGARIQIPDRCVLSVRSRKAGFQPCSCGTKMCRAQVAVWHESRAARAGLANESWCSREQQASVKAASVTAQLHTLNVRNARSPHDSSARLPSMLRRRVRRRVETIQSTETRIFRGVRARRRSCAAAFQCARKHRYRFSWETVQRCQAFRFPFREIVKASDDI